jgi:hypothetical protein
MNKTLKTALAAGFLTTLALPLVAQEVDYAAMTCAMWGPLSAADKIYAANGLQVFVKEATNHTIAGAATELLDNKPTADVIAVIDNGCLDKPAETTLIGAVRGN